jgi:hypothetical protein
VDDEADGQHITYNENGFINTSKKDTIDIEHGKFTNYFDN